MIATIFDTETSGLLSSGLLDIDKQPEVIELMAVKMNLETGERIKEYEFFVRPTKEISDEITKITGITNADLENEKPFSNYIDQVKEALEDCDAVIAHNLSFDKEMIDIEMKRCGETIKWPRLICTVEQSMPLRGYRLSLTDLYAALDLGKFEGAHRARNDVEALVKCVVAMKIEGYI